MLICQHLACRRLIESVCQATHMEAAKLIAQKRTYYMSVNEYQYHAEVCSRHMILYSYVTNMKPQYGKMGPGPQEYVR